MGRVKWPHGKSMKKLTANLNSYYKDWWLKRDYDGGRYITNFRKELAPIYIQAIELGQFDFLEVREHPNPDTPAFKGQVNPRAADYFSLYSHRHTDLTEFWEVHRRIELLAGD